MLHGEKCPPPKRNNNTLKYPAEQKLQNINMFGNTRMAFHFEVVALLGVDAGEASVLFFFFSLIKMLTLKQSSCRIFCLKFSVVSSKEKFNAVT